MFCVEKEECCHGMNSSSSASATASRYRYMGRSMRTIRSNFISNTNNTIDLHLQELAAATKSPTPSYSSFMSLSSSSDDDDDDAISDISGELQRLASSSYLHPQNHFSKQTPELLESCQEVLQTKLNFSSEILLIERISPTDDLQPTTLKICVDSLNSSSVATKRSAAAKLRLLAKNRSDNRALIGESGAIPALIPLLRSTDPLTQEHAVTALLNLSLLDENKPLIVSPPAAMKSIIYVLKTGTEVSKQNGACVLLSLALVDDNTKACIGASGAIPPLVSLLINACSNRGKKDALTTLYKLCCIKVNKKRAVTAGVVKPLVGLLFLEQEEEEDGGMAEKAMVVLSSLCEIEEGRILIVEQGGIAGLLNVIQQDDNGTTVKGKELAVVTLLQLVVCQQEDNKQHVVTHLVAEGAIPRLVALSRTTTKVKHKAERLLRYLRRQQGSSSSSFSSSPN